MSAGRWRSVLVEWVAPGFVFFVSLGLNLVNTSRYPYTRAHFDWAGHVEYIQRIARTWKPPTAVDGWEMFQPPLYYYLSALVYRIAGGDATPESALKAVQYFGCLIGVGLTAVTWAFARGLCRRHSEEPLIAVLFAAFLPMSLYMNPLITNEVFSATLIAAVGYGFVRWLSPERDSIGQAVLAGFFAGVALLSKYTGLFVGVAGAGALGFRALARGRTRDAMRLGIYGVSALAICGWFYIRNISLFGDPFVGNWDEASGFHYEQNPSYRTWEFYLGFGSVFFHHPERSRWTTFLDGNYGSMWADSHNNFFTMENTHAYFWTGVLTIVAFLPTCTLVLGFVRSLLSVVRKPADNPEWIPVAMTVWTMGSLLLFTMEVPTYSTVKAFFFLSLVPAMGVFLVRGREFLSRYAQWGRWILDASLLAVGILEVALFRF